MSAFLLSGFADEISPNLDEQLASFRELGIRYMEPRTVDGRNVMDISPEEAVGLGKRFRDGGVGISALGSPAGKIDIREEFEPHLNRFHRMLDTAEALSCRLIRVFSFFLPEEEDPGAFRGQVLRRLEAFCKAAQGRGILLLHENEKRIFGDVPERCMEILREFPEAMRMTYDPSNFVQCGVDNAVAFPMLRPYIHYMHLKDSVYAPDSQTRDRGFEAVSDAHRPVGQGDGKVKWILQSLKDSGFSGFASIEPHLVSCDLVPGTPLEKFRAAAEAARKLLREIGDA